MADETEGPGKVVNLGGKRSELSQSSEDWSPVECLRATLAEVENDELEITRLVICFETPPDSANPHGRTRFRAARLMINQALGLLERVKFDVVLGLGPTP